MSPLVDPAIGATLVRLASGITLLAHGPFLKGFVTGMPYQIQLFERIGYPGTLAWYVLAIETIAGVMMVLGYHTRFAAAAALTAMVGAISAHFGNGWPFAFPGGGWEYPAFWSVILVAQVFLGDGACALFSGRKGAEGSMMAQCPALSA